MKRLCALLLAALLLCGCAQAAPAAPESEPAGERRSHRQLRLSIQKGVSEEAAHGLDVFISKVEELSDGRLRIEKSASDDPIAALDSGSDLIFASNAEIARANGDFLSYASPFYFSDYTHLTITLNSASFRELIRGKTGSLLSAAPLAAFYGGNRVFLSDESSALDVWDGWQGLRVTISDENELLGVALDGLGAQVGSQDEGDLLDGLLEGRYRTIDCGLRELAGLDSPTVHDVPIELYESFHAAKVDWLMLSDKTCSSLDGFELAVLEEAAACALAANDAAVTREEEDALAHARALGITSRAIRYASFCEQTDAVFQQAVRYRNLWDWTLHDTVRQLAQTGG